MPRHSQTVAPDEAPFYFHHEICEHSFSMLQHHFHQTYELYYLRSGERYYFINDRSYHIMPGNLVLIPPLVLHKTSEAASTHHERILINFQEGFIAGLQAELGLDLLAAFQAYPVIRPAAGSNAALEAILGKLLAESSGREHGGAGYQKLLLAELLLFIYREVRKQPAPNASQAHPSELHHHVSLIARHINHHYREPLSLSAIAAQFHISTYYLCHIFKKVTGFTLIEYVHQVRIREARTLLQNSRQPISAIAEQCGFESSTHFGRIFKSLNGCSPLQYRKRIDKAP